VDPKVFFIPAKPDRIVKNVGIYCRVSTPEKDQLSSLSAQISALTRAVSHVEQWKLRDTFIDIGSAKSEVPRKEFERMLQECEAHNISVILTKSISRFGRDTVDTLEALKRLKAAGTRVIFEGDNLDTDNTDSNLMISVFESLAQAENETRSENIRMGLSFRAAGGTSGLYKRRLYGYDKTAEGELVLNKEQAQAVRDIFRWYIDGKSVLGIIKELEKNDISSPTGKPKWSKRSVENVLTNEKYTGTVRLTDSVTGQFQYLAKDNHPPIITEDVFRDAQEAKKCRSNVVTDENGTHRKSQKYSSKGK
jgi:DNA invertase Pin-like site-specific DNA recombinase